MPIVIHNNITCDSVTCNGKEILVLSLFPCLSLSLDCVHQNSVKMVRINQKECAHCKALTVKKETSDEPKEQVVHFTITDALQAEVETVVTVPRVHFTFSTTPRGVRHTCPRGVITASTVIH